MITPNRLKVLRKHRIDARLAHIHKLEEVIKSKNDLIATLEDTIAILRVDLLQEERKNGTVGIAKAEKVDVQVRVLSIQDDTVEVASFMLLKYKNGERVLKGIGHSCIVAVGDVYVIPVK